MPDHSDILEPLCADCTAHEGLCRKHAREILPQLKEPSWPRMIGDCYVCTDPRCVDDTTGEDHRACIDVPGHRAPRAECGCHNCAQRRWARARAAEQAEAIMQPTPQLLKLMRSKARKAEKKQRPTRFARALAGERTRCPSPVLRSA